MGKFDGLLICTDLDGTLLSSEKKISEKNMNAIEYFKKEGGIFTFITGRMPCVSGDIYDMIHPNAPFGCINGGGVYDKANGKYLWSKCMPDSVIDVVDIIMKECPDIGVQINTLDEIIFCRDNIVMEEFRRITRYPENPGNPRDVKDAIAKVVFGINKQDDLEQIRTIVSNHPIAKNFGFVQAEKYLCEILPEGVCKGLAIPRMAELLGVDIKNTLAVGDYYNDISMLEAAGVGVAVANALDEVKQVADYITVSNDESAIAQIISDIETGKIKF